MKNKGTKVVCIIPARYGSSRLPGKPLKDLGGKTVIQRIIKEVERFGGKAMMTRSDHISGSDRIAEVAENIEADIIVNVQGDEPFINPEQIKEAVDPLLEDPTLPMSTLCRRINSEEERNKIGVVKVIRDLNDNALYFSRSVIPYPRNVEYTDYFEHIGLYVYRGAVCIDTPEDLKQALKYLKKIGEI